MYQHQQEALEAHLQPALLNRWAYMRPMSPKPMIPIEISSMFSELIGAED